MPGKNKKRKIDWTKQEEVLPSAKSDPNYGRQIALGTAQGIGDIAQLGGYAQAAIQAPLTYGLLTEEQREEVATPSGKVQAEEFLKKDQTPMEFLAWATSDDDLMPPTTLPGQRGVFAERLEEIPEEGTLQEGVRRGVRSLPGLLGGPALFAEMTARELAGLGGKKIAEKMGLKETGQAVFDLGFSLFPNPKKFIEGSSKIISKAATGEYTTQKEMVKAAREMGWSEQEIAPLVREGWFSNVLSKLSPKGSSTEKALDITASAVGKGFEHVKESAEAMKVAGAGTRNRFISGIEKQLPDLTEKAKKVANAELESLYNSDMKGRDFVSFWQKMNRYYQELPELQALKGATGRAIKEIDGGLAKNFEMANTLSQRFRDVSKKLKPNLLSQLITGGEIVSGLSSLLSFQLPIAAAGLAGARKVSELMTTNPRFINLHKKMLTSINAGQMKASEKIMNSMINMVAKESPEMAAEIRKTSLQELRELIHSAKSEEESE